MKPAADVAERQTGAAIRKVGLPLDGELRRSRVYGGREAKSITPETSLKDGPVETRPTGAVTRPPKTVINHSVNPSDKIDRGDRVQGLLLELIRRKTVESLNAIRILKADQRTNPDIVTPSTTSKTDEEAEQPSKTARPQRRNVVTRASRYEPPARKYEPPQRSEPTPRYEL